MNPETLQLLISVGMKVAGYLVPALGGLIGGPLGWLATFILTQGMKWLTDKVTEGLRMKVISDKVNEQVQMLNAAVKNLVIMQKAKNPKATKEEYNAARKKLKDSARNLIRFDIGNIG